MGWLEFSEQRHEHTHIGVDHTWSLAQTHAKADVREVSDAGFCECFGQA